MSGLCDDGAVHMLEAAVSSVLVVAVLFYINSAPLWPVDGRDDGLRLLSSDILSVLQYRANSPEHPSIGFALYSQEQWRECGNALGSDIERMLPAGVYYCLDTPYGSIGRMPSDGMSVYSRPFVAFGDTGKMLDCRLILWRA
ncbi:DUF7262 family protein [Methanocella conradii]|uniref:DUF7262 family protein n=1 Tax=Methanocella conradii TaxID=1175444 RepID=UPI0024B3BD64|nr:hypothetical protein [Methanocella conradii]MDI6897135.1 hypothetical protein [Methanocella conradii]